MGVPPMSVEPRARHPCDVVRDARIETFDPEPSLEDVRLLKSILIVVVAAFALLASVFIGVIAALASIALFAFRRWQARRGDRGHAVPAQHGANVRPQTVRDSEVIDVTATEVPSDPASR